MENSQLLEITNQIYYLDEIIRNTTVPTQDLNIPGCDKA